MTKTKNLTPKQKAKEIILQLGLFNGLYLTEEVLIQIEDYPNNNFEEWLEVKSILTKKIEKL